MRLRVIALVGAIIALGPIIGATRWSRPSPKPIRILFIGNSLTSSNDLPGIVQAVAKSRDIAVQVETCTPGGFSLEDHWNRGDCRKTLVGSKFDVVVLQQGPSSLPA